MIFENVSPNRRENMRRIKSKNTRPELLLRSALHRAGYRFRIHRVDLPGSPDIVMPGRRAVVFVHGCFWHGHTCHLFRVPKTRTEFWLSKIARNRSRDRQAADRLRSLGWSVVVVWQCELANLEGCLARVVNELPDSH
jgi:DNA mismatch endonuclease (patch repair protein)